MAQRGGDVSGSFKSKSRKRNQLHLPALKVGRVLRSSAFLSHCCAPCLSWAPCCKSCAPIWRALAAGSLQSPLMQSGSLGEGCQEGSCTSLLCWHWALPSRVYEGLVWSQILLPNLACSTHCSLGTPGMSPEVTSWDKGMLGCHTGDTGEIPYGIHLSIFTGWGEVNVWS